MKGNSKLASQVLETRDLYKTRALKTRFALDELDTIVPHRSRVLKTRFLQSKNRVFKTQFASGKLLPPHRSRVYKT